MIKTTDRTCYLTKNCGDFKFEYRLLQGNIDGREAYSFDVSSYENGVLTDEEFAFDVTSNKKTARAVFASLCKNTVTPCTLFDCLEVILNYE